MSSSIRGALTILLASLCAGVGNAITGLTAHDYVTTGSLLPAMDIAIANTIGGLSLIAIAYLFWSILLKRDSSASIQRASGKTIEIRNRQSLVSGALKGTNTCLFVISTTYIVATQSLVYESTYIVWSLLLGVAFLSRRAGLTSSALKAALMLVGVFLVSGETGLNGSNPSLGTAFGISAGLTFAIYLFAWSFITQNLESVRSKLVATGVLLTISLITILILAELASLILLRTVWIPWTSLKSSDIMLQSLNGALVIGAVYLLLTTGMSALRSAREGAHFISSILISFMIPFTLLTEFVIGKFAPTVYQLVGIFVFMAGFILVGLSLSGNEAHTAAGAVGGQSAINV